MLDNKIDIIIPCYNVEDFILRRCLNSIACQDILDDLYITLVDDASTKQNYQDVISSFGYMNIQILTLNQNGGPGMARQFGMDNTNHEYITFIDADDTFKGALALKILRNGINSNNIKYDLCVADFEEIHELDKEIYSVNHVGNMVWVFGKLYRRSTIKKFNINFPPISRASEDVGFNTIFSLMEDDEKLIQINFIKDKIYYWHGMIENSITRRNECFYNIDPGKNGAIYGFIINKIYAINTVKNLRGYFPKLYEEIAGDIFYLYNEYLSIQKEHPEYLDKHYEHIKFFYKEIFSIEKNTLPVKFRIDEYWNNEKMKKRFFKEEISSFTIYDFLNQLEIDCNVKRNCL